MQIFSKTIQHETLERTHQLPTIKARHHDGGFNVNPRLQRPGRKRKTKSKALQFCTADVMSLILYVER
jgi:hypothetical protein